MQFVVNLSHVSNDARLAELAHGLLEQVVSHNCDILRAFPALPPLHSSGVVFRDEPWAIGPWRLMGGCEQFCHLLEVLRRGWGDCAQLCAWRVAELRVGGWRVPESPAGEKSNLRYYVRSTCPLCPERCSNETHPQRRRAYHVEVRRQKWPEIEDPSRRLSF
mgnify:CR=1 FL=1